MTTPQNPANESLHKSDFLEQDGARGQDPNLIQNRAKMQIKGREVYLGNSESFFKYVSMQNRPDLEQQLLLTQNLKQTERLQ